MTLFSYEGATYTLVEDPLVPEVAMVERAAKMGWSDLTESEQTHALFFIGARRGGWVGTWPEFCESANPADFDVLGDDEADPTSPAQTPDLGGTTDAGTTGP